MANGRVIMQMLYIIIMYIFGKVAPCGDKIRNNRHFHKNVFSLKINPCCAVRPLWTNENISRYALFC